jgi:DNA-binding MarR family transcriptional regulator
MDAGISSRSDKLQEGLEALLVEVNGLANRLKSNNLGETIPSASRAALQILQRCGPQTVPQIARARFSSRQNIQILVNRLQKEGLLEFVGNPEHKRSVLVRLTHRGQAAIAEASREEAELNTKLLPSFSQTELTFAAEVLNKLRRMLDGRSIPNDPATGATGKTLSERRDKGEGQPSTSADSIKKEDAVSGAQPADATEGELPVSLL